MKDITLGEPIKVHGTIFEVVSINLDIKEQTCVLDLRRVRRMIQIDRFPKHPDNGNDPIIN